LGQGLSCGLPFTLCSGLLDPNNEISSGSPLFHRYFGYGPFFRDSGLLADGLLLGRSGFGKGFLDDGGLRNGLGLRLRQITDLVAAAAPNASCDLAAPPNSLLDISEPRWTEDANCGFAAAAN
jgi:hypothetical protein